MSMLNAVKTYLKNKFRRKPMVSEEVVKNFRKRILSRFNDKSRKQFPGRGRRDKTFEVLFGLPDWVSLDSWLFLQLRGRPEEAYYDLSVDHIIALDRAKDYEEFIKLFSWENTRLIPPELNSKKSSFWDEENKELCQHLLGREFNGEDRDDIYLQQREIEEGDRFAKLMSRGKGKSQRMLVNGKDSMQKKKDYRNKKRRK